MPTSQEFTPEQQMLLMRLDAIADQIKKAQFLNCHFQAFELSNVAWQCHVRDQAAIGMRVVGSPAGAVLADDPPREAQVKVGEQIGWCDPGSKRFCYSDVKDSSPERYESYSVRVFCWAVLGDNPPVVDKPVPPGPPDPPRPATRRDVG